MHGSTSPQPLLRGPVPLGHLLLRRFVRNGDRVVDATCGNGKDTLLLAELVGPSGTVWAFDIQETALERTRERLRQDGRQEQVRLLHAGHERIAELITQKVQAIVFNLGWLPGGPREIATATPTTLQALHAALPLLSPGGLLLITCYPGHPGGDEETAAVQHWCGTLPPRRYFVWRMGQLNVPPDAPFCLLVQVGGDADA